MERVFELGGLLGGGIEPIEGDGADEDEELERRIAAGEFNVQALSGWSARTLPGSVCVIR